MSSSTCTVISTLQIPAGEQANNQSSTCLGSTVNLAERKQHGKHREMVEKLMDGEMLKINNKNKTSVTVALKLKG